MSGQKKSLPPIPDGFSEAYVGTVRMVVPTESFKCYLKLKVNAENAELREEDQQRSAVEKSLREKRDAEEEHREAAAAPKEKLDSEALKLIDADFELTPPPEELHGYLKVYDTLAPLVLNQKTKVTNIGTATSLSASPSTVGIGQTATLGVTVSPSAATGTVTFKDGSTTLGTATLSAGTASLSKAFTSSGTHPLTAVYAGAGNYAGSTSATFNESVAALTPTTTSLVRSTSTASIGQSITLTASVSPNTATGVVTFLDGGTSIGAGTLSAGVAKLATSFSRTGLHSLTASYGGVAPYAGSVSAASSVAITSTTTTRLSASTLSTTSGQTITLTVNLTPSSASGTVTFRDGSTTLGSASLASGAAILNKAFSVLGLHQLSASYAGDGYAQPSNSGVLSLAINGAPGVIPPAPSASAPVVGYGYDAQGNATHITNSPDGLALDTFIQYDGLRRPKNISDAAYGSTQLTYDGQSNVVQVNDPKGLSTQYPRDGLGQATQLISPDTGTANLTYDAAGNLLTRTDSRGVLAQYSYDALNRLTAASLSQSGQASQSYSWSYDQTGSMFTFGIGRLTSIGFPEGTTSYAYDAQGRVTVMRQILSANSSANTLSIAQYTSFGYDAAGNRTSLTYPSGRVLNISYANGLPVAMDLGGTPLINSLVFAPFGAPKSWNWVMNSGTVAHSRTMDTSGRLTRYPLGEHLRDVSYDPASRITGYTHYIGATGSPAPSQDQQFAYDSLDRLTQATTALASWTYTYDANGNRTSAAISNGSGAVTNTYIVDPASNRLANMTTPPITLTHDAMGNIVSDGTFTMTYDLRGRLTAASQGGYITTYTYDNAGQRVRKFNNTGPSSTQVYVYDLSGQLLGEYDGAGNAIREYVWLGDMPVAMVTPDPAQGANANTAAPLIYYIHADHLNTPRVVVDKTNAMRWRWLAEPFGTTAADTSPAGLADLKFNLRFPGQFFDAESGMMYNYQRDYIPGIGRYAQSDPIGLGGGINTYSYVGGNPLNFTDPNGLNPLAGAINGGRLGAAGGSSFGPVGTAVGGIGGALVGAGIGWYITGPMLAKPPTDAYDPNGPKAPGKPGDDEGFCPPKGGDDWVRNPNGRGNGWRDKGGNVWVPTGPGGEAHGGPHWDVQNPGGGYVNDYPGGTRR